MRISYITISVLILFSSCNKETDRIITDPFDYAAYLAIDRNLDPMEEEARFWQDKTIQTPGGFSYYEKLGSTYLQLFNRTGQIGYLNQSYSAFNRSTALVHGKRKIPGLLSLSALSIMKHDFESAAHFAVEAREISSNKLGPLLMQFDAEMELGNFETAGTIIAKARNFDSFDCLVRLSKFKDYQGDLDSAILLMERAEILVEREHSTRRSWAKVNLGDMYGHAGRVDNSYQKYIEALALDSLNSYALKGIAWIAYSHDGQYQEALNILGNLQERTGMPDYLLLMAEIHAFLGEEEKSMLLKEQFIHVASDPDFLGMYDRYLSELYVERGDIDSALKLATEEVQKRPTPASFDRLARVYYAQGNLKKSVEIYRENVEGKTFEPDANYFMGLVYHKAGMSLGRTLLQESLASSYELGPAVRREILQALTS